MPGKDTHVYPVSGDAEAEYFAEWMNREVPEAAVKSFRKKLLAAYGGDEERARIALGFSEPK